MQNNKTCKECNEIKDKKEFSGRSLRCKYCTNQNSIKIKIEKAISEGKEYKYKPILEYDVDRSSKICTKCEEEKILSEYYVNNKSKDGHTARCIKCISRRKVITYVEITSKICNTCDIRKELIDFYKDDECRLGHKNKCKTCESISKKIYRDNRVISIDEKLKSKKYHEKYRLENKDIIDKKLREYRIENNDKVSEKNKKYYSNNKEKVKLYGYSYRNNNKYKILERNRKYTKNRKKVDIVFKLRESIRTSIGNSFRNFGYSKKSRTHEILGCSFVEFKLHLESKFENWMTWENRGLYNGENNFGWDIDHIIAISSARNEEEILKLNHYSNFQPLCSYVNRNIKRDRLDYI
jgi:hypothetical protein